MYKPRGKLAPFVHLLGKVHDIIIAKMAGVSRQRVFEVRQQLQCKKEFVGKYRRVLGKIDWSTVPLGEKTDKEIGEMLGISCYSARNARVRAQIPPCRRTKSRLANLSDTILFGSLASEISAIYRICRTTISRERRRRREAKGIYVTAHKRLNWEEILPLLGRYPDAQIARIFSCCSAAIENKRRKLNIPRYRREHATSRTY